MYKILILLFFISTSSWAQLANDCVDAIIVCGNSSVASNAVGFGTQELDNTANVCLFEETNSIWLQLNIAVSGSLSFVITPDDANLVVDYDFFVFGPSSTCGNFNDPIRCSTTNPLAAGLNNNTTGLRDSETDQNEGPGQDGNSFVSSIPVVAGETYFLLVDRPVGDGGFNLVWTGTSDFFDAPAFNEPEDIDLCVSTSDPTIDLTAIPDAINNDPDVEVTLYTSLADAFDSANNIQNLQLFSIDNPQTTIYARIEGMNGCFEITEFNINTINLSDVDIDLEFTECGQNGNNIANFNLIVLSGSIRSAIFDELDNPTNLNLSISFHLDETSAISGSSPLPIPNFNTGSTTLFARVQNTGGNPSCFTTISINLVVITSSIPAVLQLVQCDVDEINSIDAITALNLEQAFIVLPDSADYDFFFFETVLDRSNNDPINNPIGYVNTTPFNQTIFYTAVNIITGCRILGELEVQVQPTTVSLNLQSPFVLCDENPDETIIEATFDLENIRELNYANLEATFYESLEDLSLELNPLSGNITTESTTLFVRIENSNQCQGVEEIELRVNPLPTFEIPESFILCTDGDPIEIIAPLGFDTYRTVLLEGNTEQVISTLQNITITEAGDYTLEVGRTTTINGEIITCTAIQSFEVLPSNRAIIQQIDVLGANTIEVTVSGEGIYEFSIDGENYQDSNFFENLDVGIITVFVRDKNGCGITEDTISVIGFPNFFTPNNDNINDFWQIIGLEDDAAQNTLIYIYDRYGKLITQVNPSSNGWDGTLNNSPLPSSDYWFEVNLADNRKFRGHFTLKR